jgi:hypothetical protein
MRGDLIISEADAFTVVNRINQSRGAFSAAFII